LEAFLCNVDPAPRTEFIRCSIGL